MKKIVVLLIGLTWVSYVFAGELNWRYRGYVDVSLGDAYNLNTSQLISTNNMQFYYMISSSHGVAVNNWFVGVGVGYYHSCRDREDLYPIYVVERYMFDRVIGNPYLETRGGIIYDPFWERKIQVYGSLGTGIEIFKRIQVGIRLSMFSRPSRFFTANAAFSMSYSFGN